MDRRWRKGRVVGSNASYHGSIPPTGNLFQWIFHLMPSKLQLTVRPTKPSLWEPVSPSLFMKRKIILDRYNMNVCIWIIRMKNELMWKWNILFLNLIGTVTRCGISIIQRDALFGSWPIFVVIDVIVGIAHDIQKAWTGSIYLTNNKFVLAHSLSQLHKWGYDRLSDGWVWLLWVI